jgi:predicted acetyltransferase
MGTEGMAMRSTEPTGQVRLLDVEEAKPLMREVYEQIRPSVAGMLTRSDGWWHARHLHEREGGGSSKRRFAVCFDGEYVGGYVAYRQKGKWEDFIAQGEIEVSELMAITPEAHRALWSFLINIDLFTELEWWNVAVDDPLPEIVTDPRRVVRTLVDGMWLRLLDIPAAVRARVYESDGAIVLRVEDSTRPANSGTYRIEVVDGAADCSPTSDEPDVTCDVDVLGHLYLGGGNALAMAAAGRLLGSPTAVTSLHRLFRTDRAPWCPEVF